MKLNLCTRYGFLWATLGLFLISIAAHWTFAWRSYVDEQKEHNQPIESTGYLNRVLEGTFENWQSEFLQLIWQVGALAYLFWIGSPQSKEGDDRKEEKLDALLKLLDEKKGAELVRALDKKYPKK
jgi:hypothetical protein